MNHSNLSTPKLETKKRELRRAKLEAKRRIKSKAVKGAIFVFVRWSVSAGAASLLRALQDESSLAAPLISAVHSSGNILPLQAHRPEGCFHTAGDGGQEVLRIYDVTFAFYLNSRVIKPLGLTTSYLLLRGPSYLLPPTSASIRGLPVRPEHCFILPNSTS